MTSDDLKAAIRLRYDSSGTAREYAVFEEVRSMTGFAGVNVSERYADAMALGLWPSSGLPLIGFEVKASRGDWLRELKQPEKAKAIQRYCDHWFIVAPEGVVKLDELLPHWGLYEATWEVAGNYTPAIRERFARWRHIADGDTKMIPVLSKRVGAKRISAEPLDRAFVASLVRNLYQGRPM